MIEVTVAYPAGQGRTFNMDYYLKTHIPLFQKRMGAAMKTIRVSRGIGGSTPTSPAAFVAMVHDPTLCALCGNPREGEKAPQKAASCFHARGHSPLHRPTIRSVRPGCVGTSDSRARMRKQNE